MDSSRPLGHTALVTGISNGGRTIHIIDGNWGGRVRSTTRARDRSMRFFWPDYDAEKERINKPAKDKKDNDNED
jgi:hypothetical protein